MNLIVQPDSGVDPVLTAIRKASKSIDIMIFRLDIQEMRKALAAAVARGVNVRALIAHTNRGGEKTLRKLEQALLDAGVTVSRTGDDFVRYHGKMMIVDDEGAARLRLQLHLARHRAQPRLRPGAKHKRLVQEAMKVFEADSARQPYTGCLRSIRGESRKRPRSPDGPDQGSPQAAADLRPEDQRSGSAAAPEGTRQGRRGSARHRQGCRAPGGVVAEKYPGKRLHVRAIVQDGHKLFLGSQSLRRLELDKRREIGVIVDDKKAILEVTRVFEADWALTPTGKACG